MMTVAEAAPELTAEQAQVLREKAINEEYKLWKKNSPFLYDMIISHSLSWPSLNVEWLPDVESVPDRKCTVHRLVLGTNTSRADRDYLLIANVQIPNPEYDVDGEKYDETTGEAGGFGAAGADSKISVTQRIPHEYEVNRARYMPGNPNIIATRTATGDVLVFDRTKHESKPPADAVCEPEIRLVGHTKEGYGLSWSRLREGFLLTGGEDKVVCEWDINGYSKQTRRLEPISRYAAHTDYVEDVEYSPIVESMFASCGDDQRLLIWDTRSGQSPSIDIHAHQCAVNCVSWSPKEKSLILTGGADGKVELWDIRNPRYSLHTFASHEDEILQLKWSPFGETVFGSASADRRVNIWDISRVGEEQTTEETEDGPPELLFVHGGHSDKVLDFSWNPNQEWVIASVAENNICQVWQMASNIRFTDLPTVDDAMLE